ncbi:MAG: PD-(D/E)XK nuclease family protein [Acidobacteria bacterium]|nr:MAG: PD-(D/E)XK nuclease family protein [Acidobacteriota bacterium]
MTRRIVKSWSNGRLIAAAAEFISLHSETVAILPGHLAGEELAHSGRGLAGFHRTTLVQLAIDLARPTMAERGLAPLSNLGLEALAARVVHAARGANELPYFGPVSALPGFARALARTLAELRLARVKPDALRSSGPPGADLSRLLLRYEAELTERSLTDLASVFEFAIEAAVKDDHRMLGLPLAVLDAPLDSHAHREFFARVAERAPAVLAAVTWDDGSLERVLGVTSEDLDPAAPAASLEHLRTHLFTVSPPAAKSRDYGFDLFSAPGEGLECVEIARRVLRLAGEGAAFDQMAILLRSPERYQPMIEDALRRARIPAYFSRGTARPDPGGRAFLALLACAAEKCSASRFAEYLSLGQVPPAGFEAGSGWVPADDEMLAASQATAPDESAEPDVDESRVPRAPSGWEKLLVDAAVIGGRERWARRLAGLENEFDLRLKTLERDDDPRRRHLARQLDQLRELERFALPLIDKLDALPAAAPWDEWLDRLSDLARVALRRPDPVLAVLAEFEPMGQVGPATLEEVAEVMSERLRFLRREPPQRRYGHVFVGSIDEARGCEFGIVFLPGLAEGLFPQRALEDPLLLDDFRRLAGEHLLVRDDRVDRERLRLHLAVAAARERLIASYPRMDVAEARPRVPSFYALELPRAIEGSLPELSEFERRAREAAPARLNWPAPRDAADAIDDAEYDLVMLDGALADKNRARYLVEANPHLARSLRTRWSRWRPAWKEADGLITADPDALAALAANRLNARAWSPSALQQFAVCPYRFALHGIYELRPREEAAALEQMDPLTRGGLFHAVQFALFGELKSAALLPLNGSRLAEALTIADRVLDQVAASYEEQLAPAIPRVWKSEIEDLRTDLRGWLQHIATNDDDWEPVHFEFGFGLRSNDSRDPASTTEEASLAEGVRLRGSIDLVERHTTRGVLRVTDHKTGKPPDKIPAYVGGGVLLQPLLYGLAAERLLAAQVESGRLFYATQRGGYQHALIPLTERARAFLAKLLENIDGAIAGGFLPPAPQKGSCEMCDYRVVCGPYEELRVARHKDRGDARLEPLTEIRAMA